MRDSFSLLSPSLVLTIAAFLDFRDLLHLEEALSKQHNATELFQLSWKNLVQKYYLEMEITVKMSCVSRWKTLFSIHYSIEQMTYSFRIFNTQGCLEKAGCSSVKKGLITSAHLGQQRGSKQDLPQLSQRNYLFGISGEPSHRYRFIIHDNVIWFLFTNGDLNGKSLIDTKKPMYTAPKGRLRKLLISNQEGILVTADFLDLIEVWSVEGLSCKKIKQIQSLKSITSLDIYGIQLCALLKDGSVTIWDAINGSMISALKLDGVGWNLLCHAKEARIVLSSSCLVISMGSFFNLAGYHREVSRHGTHFVYVKDRFGLYTLISTVPSVPDPFGQGIPSYQV
jgi:hypothetical protein